MCLVFQRCVTYKGQEYHGVEKCNNDNEGSGDDGVCLVSQWCVRTRVWSTTVLRSAIMIMSSRLPAVCTYKGQEYHSVEKCNNDNEFSSSSGVYLQGP